MLKADLKKWNVKVFGDVNASRRGLVKRLGELDALAEGMGLSYEETMERQHVQADFWRISKLNEEEI